MKINFKKLTSTAVAPSRAHVTDAGWDLTATECSLTYPDLWTCKTGIAVEIPEGHFGAVFPRSSVKSTPLTLSNSVGVIDAGYRGEIVFHFRRNFSDRAAYKAGDRIGQLVILPLPAVEFVEAQSLSDSPRGTGGFGSTGV